MSKSDLLIAFFCLITGSFSIFMSIKNWKKIKDRAIVIPQFAGGVGLVIAGTIMIAGC